MVQYNIFLIDEVLVKNGTCFIAHCFLIFLLEFGFSSHALAQDNAVSDGICFPIYRAANAIPGTGLDCELNASTADVGLGTYFCTGTPDIIDRYCKTPMIPDSCPSTQVGNPIDTSNGNKKQVETDYSSTGYSALQLIRYYNSNTAYAASGSFGKVWRMTYDRRVSKGSSSMAYVTRQNGRIYYFALVNAAWVSQNAAIKDRLVELKNSSGATTGWMYSDTSDDSQELYDSSGRVTTMTARNGQVQTLTRSTATTPTQIAPGPGYLISVSDQFGRAISFTWNSDGTIATITDPGNGLYSYSYDSEKRLIQTVYPSDGTTTQSKTYIYNELAHTAGITRTTLLTGIQDENGVRFATFDYDAQGRGTATQHAVGVERFSIAYGSSQQIVTDPLGSQRTYRFNRIAGTLRLAGINQPGGAGCAAAANNVTYDANGNLKTLTDFNGSTTSYVFDLVRNLETKRTEAFGTPDARTTSTEWHATYRLPLRIAEPKRITLFTYSATGNLASKEIHTTTDLTGAQGLSAVPSASFLKENYTYDQFGRLLTASLPSSDGRPQTMHTYAWIGANLATVTNAAGHVQTLDNYDTHGRVGKITAANGVSTTYTYSPRGWILSETQSAGAQARRTDYTYDAVGQLTTVTFPDNKVVSYSYDDAHRLVNVTDSAGNKITYELDPAGNRIAERVTDPSGALTRQTVRIYDALNRLQNLTGEMP